MSVLPRVEPTSAQEREMEEANSPLDRVAMADVIDLALWAGQLLMQNGAESQRVLETVRTIGTGLGCDSADVFVSSNAISVTYSSGGDFRTKIRGVTSGGVDMTIVAALSHLAHRVSEGKFDRQKVRAELERISTMPRHYNRWLTAAAVGLAGAAFSRLLGGDWPVFGVTLVAAAAGMLLRQTLTRRHFNVLLIVVITAFVIGLLVGVANLFQFSPHPELAVAAAVLLLVPGIPFVNAVEDLIKGHISLGLARGTMGALIIFAIALGLILAMALTGVTGV
ncbi:MAG TPA: threonine/serine exporter family protein [Anaerolineae bacterium]|nr:threonine/serine exporter family protein [Anaerolineae bacterium]